MRVIDGMHRYLAGSLKRQETDQRRVLRPQPGQLPDRVITESNGLAARTVASIRRRSTDALPQLNAGVGRGGRIQPLAE
jgi:hypothetical protein